jgi:hypothetical protein
VITAWFTGKVPFTFRLPDSADDLKHHKVYRLTGGRLVNYNGGCCAGCLSDVAGEDQPFSLFSTSAVAAGGEEIASGRLLFHDSKKATFNIITWSNHGLTYALVFVISWFRTAVSQGVPPD